MIRTGNAWPRNAVVPGMHLAAATIVLAVSSSAMAAPCLETEKTSAAVQCVEDHWQKAFLGGDASYLTALLSDDYHSYTAAGVGRDRATVVKLARDYAKDHPKPDPAPSDAPPADIQLRGDTAIVFWKTKDGALSSVDAFQWKDGHWRAWYSQHAGAK